MSKTGNSPLPRPPIHPRPNTNDGRQILDQQENVSHRCFPRRASRKTSPTRPQPLAQFKGVPTFPSPKHTRPFLLFPQAHVAEKAIRRSVLYTSQRTTPQMRTYHVPDAGVSRPRRADKSYFPRILDNQPIDIIKMEDLSRNHRETCREPPRQKKSPHDSQIVIAISIGIAMLLADCSSAKPVFSPDNITIFAILM